MTKQNDIFLKYEGNNWFKRNKEYLQNFDPNHDFPIRIMKMYDIKPKKVLEIGCSMGSRLNFINKKFDSICKGIESSQKAIKEGRELFKNISLYRGIFSNIPLEEKFDLIIINFVFHWIDRKNLAKCVTEIERLLDEEGYIILGDFYPEKPLRVKYHHLPKEDVWTYKQNYTNLFLALNNYILICFFSTGHSKKDFYIEKNEDNRVFFSLLMKKSI